MQVQVAGSPVQPWLGFVLVQPGQRVQAGFSRSFLQASQGQVQRSGLALQPWFGFVLVQPGQVIQANDSPLRSLWQASQGQ